MSVLPSGARFSADSRSWAGGLLMHLERPLALLGPDGQIPRHLTLRYPAADAAVAVAGPEAFWLLVHLARHARETTDGLLHPAGAEAIAADIRAAIGDRRGWGRQRILQHLETLREHGLVRYHELRVGPHRFQYSYEIPPSVCDARPGSAHSPADIPTRTLRPSDVAAGDVARGDIRGGDIPPPDIASSAPSRRPGDGPVPDIRPVDRPTPDRPDQILTDTSLSAAPETDPDVTAAVLRAARALGWRGTGGQTRQITDRPHLTAAWLHWLRAHPEPGRNDGGYLTTVLRHGDWPPDYPAHTTAHLGPDGAVRLTPTPGADSDGTAQPETPSGPARWTPGAVADALRALEDTDRVGAQRAREQLLSALAGARAAGLGDADSLHRAASDALGPPGQAGVA